jgi:hypothetical protein
VVLTQGHHVAGIRVVSMVLIITVMKAPVGRAAGAAVLVTIIGDVSGNVLAKEIKCYHEKE